MATIGNLSGIAPGKRVYIIGNGGSYANALHIANDLFSAGVRAYVLDPSTLTMLANDYGYAYVFARWLNTMAEGGDILIALSGSGTSENIVRGIATARVIGMEIITVFGAPEYGMQEAEERQILLGHEIMRAIRGNRC